MIASNHANGDEVLNGLEIMRRDLKTHLSNFIMDIISDTTAKAMRTLEERKAELDATVQAECIKAQLSTRTRHSSESSTNA